MLTTKPPGQGGFNLTRTELFALEFAKVAESDFVYALASTNVDQLVPNYIYENKILDGFDYPFPKRQILGSTKLKEFVDDNFTWQKVLQKGRKHCGKRRNCSLPAISPFPMVFSKDLYCRHVKTRACLGKG